MRELWTLSRYSIKNIYGISALLYDRKRNKNSPIRIVLAVVLIALLLPTYIMYVAFNTMLYRSYVSINQTSAYPVQFFAAACIVIMIFAISYIISYFYMSKDLDTLLALPIKPRNIIFSKLLTILLTEYLFVFPILLPVVFTYGVNEGVGIVYYLYAFIALIVLPLVVLGIVSILVMVLMRGANLGIKKDKAQRIILFFTLAVIMAIQFSITKMSSSMGQGDPTAVVNVLLQNSNALLDVVSKIFFPASLAGKAMVFYDQTAGLMHMLLFLALALGVVVLCGILGEKFYIQAILSAAQSGKSRQKKQTSRADMSAKRLHPVAAIFKRDMQMILKTPIFMYNSIGMMIMMPLVLVIMSVASGTQKQITPDMIAGHEVQVALIAGAVFAFFTGFNPTAATTFSREGQSFWITKTMPVGTDEQMNARLLTHFLLNFTTLFLCGIAIFFAMKINAFILVIAVLLGFIATVPTGYFSFMIDASRPTLFWDNPQRAIKQNMNVLFAGLFQFLYLLVYGGISILLLFMLPNRSLALGIIILIGISIAILSDRLVRRKFRKIFFDIDI